MVALVVAGALVVLDRVRSGSCGQNVAVHAASESRSPFLPVDELPEQPDADRDRLVRALQRSGPITGAVLAAVGYHYERWADVSALASGLADTDTGLTDANGFRGEVEAVQGQDLVERSFPAGSSVPADVVVPSGGRVGPVVGALAYAGLQEQLARATDFWRLFLGLAIVALVLFFPQGLAGAARAWWEGRRGGTGA